MSSSTSVSNPTPNISNSPQPKNSQPSTSTNLLNGKTSDVAQNSLKNPKPSSTVQLTDNASGIQFTKNSSEISFSPANSFDSTIDGKKFNTWGAQVKKLKPEPVYNHDWTDASKTQRIGWKILHYVSYPIIKPVKYLSQGAELLYQYPGKSLTNAYRRRSGFENNLEYVDLLKEEEEPKVHETLKSLWEKYKGKDKLKGYTINDVASMYIKVPLGNDGKPNLKGRFTYVVVVKVEDKKDHWWPGLYKLFVKSTKTINVVTGSFSDNDETDEYKDLLVFLSESVDFPSFPTREVYSKDQLMKKGGISIRDPNKADNISNTNSTSKVTSKALQRTANDCWLHAGISGIMHNKRFIDALTNYQKIKQNPKFNEDDHLNHIIALRNIEKDFDEKSFRDYFETLKNRTKTLIECLSGCLSFNSTEEKVSEIINKHAANIRTELGADSLTSQEDAVLLTHAAMEDFFNYLGLLEHVSITNTQKLQQVEIKNDNSNSAEHTNRGKKIQKSEQEQSAILDLQEYTKDHESPSEIDAKDLINKFFEGKPNQPLEGFNPSENEVKLNWIITNETRKFNNEPKSGISFNIHRFNADRKITLPLKVVPLELAYNSGKFDPTKGGAYKLKYAIIHEGGTDSGHYKTLYKDGSDWFLYDTGKTTKIEPQAAKTVNEIVQEHLEQAVYLHYEKE